MTFVGWKKEEAVLDRDALINELREQNRKAARAMSDAGSNDRRTISDAASSRVKSAIGASFVGLIRRTGVSPFALSPGCGDSRPHMTSPE